MRIFLNADQYNQIMTMAKNCADQGGTRPVLNGIHFVCDEQGNARAEVCDGYVGGTFSWDVVALGTDYQPGECIIMPQAPVKCSRFENPFMIIESDEKTARIMHGGTVTTVQCIAGNYLDLPRVYPTSEPVQTIYLNPDYLEKVLKAVKNKHNKLVKMEIRGPLQAVRIATADCNMLCLPVRSDEKEW